MTESKAVEGHAFRAERTHDEVVLRFPSLNRLVRAFLPAEAARHLYAAQREQLLAVRSVVDALISCRRVTTILVADGRIVRAWPSRPAGHAA